MDFYPNQLFHIYNQGNNQRQTFFEEENYHYFLWKMRAYLPLFGDLIAWCLMPNHFHWQFYVKNVSVDRKEVYEYVDQVEYERRVKKYGSRARPVQRDWTRVASLSKEVKLNDAIGDLLKSYTQALNNQMGFSGGLWLKPCKAKDEWIDEFVTLKRNGKLDYRFRPGTDYAYQCFQYIHQNPVDAGLVQRTIDYPWSSARDYAGLRKGSLCNLELGRQLIENF